MNFVPRDQIVLLAGLASDEVRQRIWGLPELRVNVARLTAAGLLDDPSHSVSGPVRLSDPDGRAAAVNLRHIKLDDLMAEHLPERCEP